jgi:hypothetical protein
MKRPRKESGSLLTTRQTAIGGKRNSRQSGTVQAPKVGATAAGNGLLSDLSFQAGSDGVVLTEIFPLTGDQRAMLVAWLRGEYYAANGRDRQRTAGRYGRRQRYRSTTAQDIAHDAKVGVGKAIAALHVLRYVPQAVMSVIAGKTRLASLRTKVLRGKEVASCQ